MAYNSGNVAEADMGAIEAAPDADAGPHILEAPVASATYAPPPLPLADGTVAKVKTPFKISSTRILVGFIIVLLLAVLLMGGFTLYALTNGPVNVTVNVPNTSSTTPPTTPPTVAVGEPNPSAPTKVTDIYIYLVAQNSDFAKGIQAADLPVGSIPLSGGKDYLIPYVTASNYAEADVVQKALNDLLALKTEKVTGTQFRTALSGTDLTVEVNIEAAGRVKVNFRGNWPAVDATMSVYAKEQVERTVQHYTLNYIVTLNGSEVAYQCIGSLSADCK